MSWRSFPALGDEAGAEGGVAVAAPEGGLHKGGGARTARAKALLYEAGGFSFSAFK